MRTPMRRLAVLGCAAAPACVPSKPPAAPVVRQPTPVRASFGRTWDAVIDAFADQNVPIKTIDRSSGFIATDQLAVPEADSMDADCGTAGEIKLVPLHATYNVVVRGDSTASSVRVTVLWVCTHCPVTRRISIAAQRGAGSRRWKAPLSRKLRHMSGDRSQ